MKMIGILLYLVNDNNARKIKKAFKSESGFELSTGKPGDKAADNSNSKGKDLVIFDIAALDINDKKNINTYDIVNYFYRINKKWQIEQLNS